MGRIRVLVVDDSSVYRRAVSDALRSDPEIEVVGVAANGHIALAKMSQLNPDVVTLDVEMPEMDGLATLEAIRKDYPRLPVIMFSSHTERAAQTTVEALLRGATDYAAKPTAGEGEMGIRAELVPKVRASVRRAHALEQTPVAGNRAATPRAPGERHRPTDIIAIGVSTGGPLALSRIFEVLPAGLPAYLVIVQHMPSTFTRILAERLTATSAVPVHEARDGDLMKQGEAWMAPGDHHLTVVREGGAVLARLDQNPPVNSCRPAVDVLFRSVAEAFGRGVLGVVLTGMGQDGYRGSERICELGGRIWAQDEATSVVWGMPGFVVREQLTEKVLSIDAIGPEIIRCLKSQEAPGGVKRRQG